MVNAVEPQHVFVVSARVECEFKSRQLDHIDARAAIGQAGLVTTVAGPGENVGHILYACEDAGDGEQAAAAGSVEQVQQVLVLGIHRLISRLVRGSSGSGDKSGGFPKVAVIAIVIRKQT